MRYAAVWRETLHPGSLPIYDRRPDRQAVGSGDQAGPESVLESGPKPTPANRRAMKPAVIKSSGVRTASTKAAVETTTKAATHAAVHAPTATATAPTARRHNVGCKHSKRRSRQQRDRDFTEHD
jgi:hypothetical protein